MMKEKTAQKDDLTGLFSRRKFTEYFSHEMEKAKATSQETPLSLALLDVDHFFKINEQ